MIPLTAGTRLGDYEIVRTLGSGGMAIVFLATDSRHGREVAIKVMDPLIAAAIGQERFLREIEIVAQLNHPHVVPLFDSGASGDLLYYVMPCIAGESLRARLEREHQLSVEDAVRIARDIASALGHAHRHGLVHRDVKPENILLAEGIPLVADFGIAHTMHAAAGADNATVVNTSAGMAIGTPQYMSPEQATGADVDARSDIYSLACVLYEMLAGQPPFVDHSPAAVIRMHVAAEPRAVTDLRSSVPAAMAQVIARALAKVPTDRFPSAAQFAEALAAALSGTLTPSPGGAVGQAVANNLPRPRTPFIGRDREVESCARLVREARLLTLTGIGGSGKTRLALKAGESSLASFPDGVWFVDLAALTDGAHILHAVASALGVQETAGRKLEALFREHVRSRHLLLIMDNCEHLLSPCAAMIDLLLDASDSIRILATSREALGIDGERVLPVQPLSLPSSSAVDVQRAGESEAVRLFVDRAQRVAPEFSVEDGNVRALVDVCRQLDGIPLAIELAAARVKVLSIDQIHARLGDRFRLLASPGRSALQRHQTLEAVVQWSYDQLAMEEARLLRCLSVFAGSWTLESAARVSGNADDEFEVLDLLGRLVDKSLVIVEREATGTRYRLLETVREYAAGRLAIAGEELSARTRHADAFIAWAENAYRERVTREGTWTVSLEVEHDNLRAALEWLKRSDTERYLQLAGALAWFWQSRSHLLEGRRHVTAALASSSAGPSRVARARALWGAANLLAWQGDAAQSIAWMQEALQMWRDLEDVQEIGSALEGLGWAQFLAGNDEEACATFEESLRLQRVTGDPHLVNRAMVSLAQVLVALARVEDARAFAAEILEFSRAHSDERSEHSGWHYLADCALIEGKCAEAASLYRKSLVLAKGIGDHIEIGFEVQGVAMSLAGLGDAERALRLGGAVEAEWERIGATPRVKFWDVLLDRYLGRAKEALGAPSAAQAWTEGRRIRFEDSITIALEAASRVLHSSLPAPF